MVIPDQVDEGSRLLAVHYMSVAAALQPELSVRIRHLPVRSRCVARQVADQGR